MNALLDNRSILNLYKLSGNNNQLNNERLEKIFSIIVESVFNDKDDKYAKYQDKVKDYIKNSGFVTPNMLIGW